MRPWVAPLTESSKQWLTLQVSAVEKRTLLTRTAEFIEHNYGNQMRLLDAEFLSASAALEIEYERLVERKIKSAAVPHIVLRRGPQRPDHRIEGTAQTRAILRVSQWLFGPLPRAGRLSPYWAPLRQVLRIVNTAAAEGAADALVLCGGGGITERFADELSGMHAHVQLSELLSGNLLKGLDPSLRFDLCVFDLPASEIFNYSLIVKAVEPLMRKGGRIVGFCANFDQEFPPITDAEWLLSLSDLSSRLRVYITGSKASVRLLRRYRRIADAARAHTWMRLPAAMAVVLAACPSSLIVNTLEARRSKFN
jgi:hypothetical protein